MVRPEEFPRFEGGPELPELEVSEVFAASGYFMDARHRDSLGTSRPPAIYNRAIKAVGIA